MAKKKYYQTPSLVFDQYEQDILRSLIKNPRITDNKISKKMNIPVKTVNRKRKELEEKNILKYYASINNGTDGTSRFFAREMVIITFKHGISRKDFIAMINENIKKNFSKHIAYSEVGESDGKLKYIMILESRVPTDINEIMNVDIVPIFHNRYGSDCIVDIETIRLTKLMRLLHNYLPDVNMDGPMLKSTWGDDFLFI